jgi:hypothetical protein
VIDQPSTSSHQAATPAPRSMTTLGKLAAALAVPCQVHQVPAGQPCPLIELQACMARRTVALGDN